MPGIDHAAPGPRQYNDKLLPGMNSTVHIYLPLRFAGCSIDPGSPSQ